MAAGFPAHSPLDAVADQTPGYAPVPNPNASATEPDAPTPKDRDAVTQGRQRLGTAEAKGLYTDRAVTAEGVNALARTQGLQPLRVRGPANVRGGWRFHARAPTRGRTVAVAPAVLELGRVRPQRGV